MTKEALVGVWCIQKDVVTLVTTSFCIKRTIIYPLIAQGLAWPFLWQEPVKDLR